jgi:hypothetical protein
MFKKIINISKILLVVSMSSVVAGYASVISQELLDDYYCNVNMVSGDTEYFDATHEACEMLVVGPDFIAEDGASVSFSSGWDIEFLPGFAIERGATLNANVLGQSLCMTSRSPMPYGRHSCVDQICAADRFCCDTEFDQICLDKVETVCGLVCE